jgi:hypothetical protein
MQRGSRASRDYLPCTYSAAAMRRSMQHADLVCSLAVGLCIEKRGCEHSRQYMRMPHHNGITRLAACERHVPQHSKSEPVKAGMDAVGVDHT